MIRRLLIILTLSLFIASLYSCSKKKEWSEDGLYSYAEENQAAYKGALVLYNKFSDELKTSGYTNTVLALSIVFPEFMRYSAFRDKMETLATTLIYTNSPESGGYSIGAFQMKPIFAQDLEKIVSADKELKLKYPLINYAGLVENLEDRKERIKRLQNSKSQIQYLYAFIDICTEKFQLESLSDEDKLTYLATAYNSGFMRSKEQIEDLSKRKTFPNGPENKNSKWNYATITKEFYRSRILTN